jgi:hypothetical protein
MCAYLGILLGSLEQSTSTNSVWAVGQKLRFGFAQMIPRGSWLRKGMYGAEFCVFSFFCEGLAF